MKEQNNMKGISRIDSGSTHGFFVRGYRNGKVYSKLFSDRKCSDKRNARNAAMEYRDNLHAKLAREPKHRRKRRRVTRDKRNTSGTLGVTRIVRKSKKTGEDIASYAVIWRPSACIQKCTSFSTRKYGEEGAKRKAVAFRKAMNRKAYG